MFLLILGVPGHSQSHMKSTQLSILYWQRTWYIDHWSSAPRMPFPGHFLKIYRTLEKCGTATFSWWTQLLVQMLPTNCMWKQKLFSMSKKSEWESERVFLVPSFWLTFRHFFWYLIYWRHLWSYIHNHRKTFCPSSCVFFISCLYFFTFFSLGPFSF